VLPTPTDLKLLDECFKEPDWIEARPVKS
jgi:hypothetical protein